MIYSLEINNFQSHKYSRLEFSEGVNVIVGTSDSGKTAVLRALRWVVNNRPSGNDFRSTWGGETSVQLVTDDGIVIRNKDKAEKYSIGVAGKKDIEFKAFGTNVPQEVSDVLNISEINLQGQMDAPFLLSKSAGEVATHFNKIARLDKIDTATANVNSWIRELTATIGHESVKDKPATGLIRQKEKLEEEIEKFKYLQKFEIEVEVLEGMELSKKGLENRLTKLNNLVKELNEIKVDIDVNFYILRIEYLLDAVLIKINVRDEMKVKVRNLYRFVQSIKTIEEEIKDRELLATLFDPIVSLLNLYKDKNLLANQFTTLNKLLKSINDIIYQLKIKEAEFDRLHQQFDDNFPDVCPLCGK